MPIPGPGVAISMNTIAAEFGGTVPHSLSEYYRGGGLVPNAPANAAIPTSGTISMGNFYGATNRVAIPLVLSTNTYNYDVYANRGPTYVSGISDITVTVPAAVTVGSTSVPAYALSVPSAFSPTDTVTIVNSGVIQGMGGTGGAGGASGNSVPAARPGNPGGGGGNAIFVNRPVVITNNGTVAGGGGGGGRYSFTPQPKGPVTVVIAGGHGGGGGAGFNGGAGGAGGTAGPGANSPSPLPGVAGNPGTSAAGGAGGTRTPATSGPGGAGGGRGAAGVAGSPFLSPGPVPSRSNTSGGAGGGAGNYIVGNPFVTWPVTGTRQGGVA